MDVLSHPNAALKQKAAPVDPTAEKDLLELCRTMAKAMYDAPGIGLAAPQIGVLKRVIVYDLEDEGRIVALCNPEIVEHGDEREVDDEGCLSLPGITVPIERPTTVVCEALSLSGKPVRIEADGLHARCSSTRSTTWTACSSSTAPRPRSAKPRSSATARRRPQAPSRATQASDAATARGEPDRAGRIHGHARVRRAHLCVALDDAAQVVGVFCRPDAVSGRGKAHAARSGEARRRADSGCRCSSRAHCATTADLSTSPALKPDLIVVAAYGLILPRVVLDAAPLGASTSMRHCCRAGAGQRRSSERFSQATPITGVSIMRMEEGLDTGPYCLQVVHLRSELPVPSSSPSDSRVLGADTLVRRRCRRLSTVRRPGRRRTKTLATYAEKVAKSDVAIDPHSSPRARPATRPGLAPAAPCRVRVADRDVTLTAAAVTEPADPEPPRSRHVSGSPRRASLLGFSDGALARHTAEAGGQGRDGRRGLGSRRARARRLDVGWPAMSASPGTAARSRGAHPRARKRLLRPRGSLGGTAARGSRPR